MWRSRARSTYSAQESAPPGQRSMDLPTILLRRASLRACAVVARSSCHCRSCSAAWEECDCGKQCVCVSAVVCANGACENHDEGSELWADEKADGPVMTNAEECEPQMPGGPVGSVSESEDGVRMRNSSGALSAQLCLDENVEKPESDLLGGVEGLELCDLLQLGPTSSLKLPREPGQEQNLGPALWAMRLQHEGRDCERREDSACAFRPVGSVMFV